VRPFGNTLPTTAKRRETGDRDNQTLSLTRFKSARINEQSLPGFVALEKSSAIQKRFYNGTDVDDDRSMQKLEMPNSPRFLKVVELAELLKVKPRTIYEMVAQNRIPYRKPPGTNMLRFDLDEILAWTKSTSNK
jgi:excisionase family DNA binding protein